VPMNEVLLRGHGLYYFNDINHNCTDFSPDLRKIALCPLLGEATGCSEIFARSFLMKLNTC